jgi:hypothetical protein
LSPRKEQGWRYIVPVILISDKMACHFPVLLDLAQIYST